MNPICRLLNISYPIFQGGMARISDPKLVASVSNSGGFGILTTVGLTADDLRDTINKTKALTNKPFGVNLMLHQENIPELVDVIIENSVSAVTTGAGSPKAYISKLQDAGIKVIPVIATVKHAIKMQDLGVDAIIAEGSEAGGHIGQISLFSLLPQIIESVDLPVIAAGGIVTGRDWLATEIFGAKGVQMGTRFLASEECMIGPNYKEIIINADDTSSIVTGQSYSMPVRCITNQWLRDLLAKEYQGTHKDELMKAATGAYSRAVLEDDVETGSVMAGLSVGRIKTILSVDEIVEQMVDEYVKYKKSFVEKDFD